jgi:hypothetical protein
MQCMHAGQSDIVEAKFFNDSDAGL